MTYQSKSIVVISWDGETEPLSHILLDTVSSFDIFLIDYSGKDNLSKVINFKPTYYLSKKSECKGDLINNVSQYLIQHSIIDFKYFEIRLISNLPLSTNGSTIFSNSLCAYLPL